MSTRTWTSPRALIRFGLVSFICLALHELSHHLTARWACGEWGTMTFAVFHLPAGCEPQGKVLLATLVGPVLTWLLIYAGVGLVRWGYAAAGTLLILANLPFARFVTVLMQGGDEMVIGRALAGELSWVPLLLLTTWLLIAPLKAVYRTFALATARPALLLAGFLVLPLFWDMILKRVVLVAALDVIPAAWHGIPVVVIAVDIGAVLLLAMMTARRETRDATPLREGPDLRPSAGEA